MLGFLRNPSVQRGDGQVAYLGAFIPSSHHGVQTFSQRGFDTSIPTVSYKMLPFQCKTRFLTGKAAFDSQDFLGFGRKKKKSETI